MRQPRPSSHRANTLPYLFVLPLVAVASFIFVYPLVTAIVLSFYNDSGQPAGLRNYVRLLQDGSFWFNLKLTVVYVVPYSVGVFFVGFVTAALSDVKWPGRRACATVMTLPYAIPDVAASLIWMWMFDYQYGILNYILTRLGIVSEPVGWLISPSTALSGVLLATIWRLFPLHSLIILAALRSVPKELYEAANIDGANAFQAFFYVTIPWIRRILEVLVLLTIVWSFQRFTILYVLTGGGPAGATETVVIRIYRTAFEYFERSYAYTMGSAVLVILIGITLVYLYFSGRQQAEGGLSQ